MRFAAMGQERREDRLQLALAALRTELGPTPPNLPPDGAPSESQPTQQYATGPVKAFRAGLAWDLRDALLERFESIAKSVELHTAAIRGQVEMLLEGLEREIAEVQHQRDRLETGDQEACIQEISAQKLCLEAAMQGQNALE